jgi:hypothetical protein
MTKTALSFSYGTSSPAISHAACGFPVLRAPAHFSSRVMRPIVPELLSAAALRPLPTPSLPAEVLTHPPRQFSLHLDVYPPSQFLQIDGCFYHFTPASLVDEESMCSRVPSLHGRYPASMLIQTQPPPSRLRSISRCCRLYDLPCSTDFSVGRGRLLQLLSVSLSPCYPYHPAGVGNRIGQGATDHVAFMRRENTRPPGFIKLSGPPVGSLALWPGDSLTIPKMALSIGFTCFVSSTRAIQATGLLTLAQVGLTPTEHASLRWTHSLPFIPPALQCLQLLPLFEIKW